MRVSEFCVFADFFEFLEISFQPQFECFLEEVAAGSFLADEVELFLLVSQI